MRTLRGTLLTCLRLSILFFCGTCRGNVWTPEAFRASTYFDGAVNCGSLSRGSVCNPDGVLTEHEVAEIDNLVRGITYSARNASVTCGEAHHYVTSVIVVDKIYVNDKNLSYYAYATHHQGDGITIEAAQQFEIKVFANYIRETSWKLGTPGCGEDIYIVLTANPVDAIISAGKLASSKLSDSCLHEVLTEEHIRHYKQSKDYAHLLETILSQIKDVLESDDSQCGSHRLLYIILGGGLGFMFLSVVVLIFTKGRCTCRPQTDGSKLLLQLEVPEKRKKNGRNASEEALPEERQPWLGETSGECIA